MLREVGHPLIPTTQAAKVWLTIFEQYWRLKNIPTKTKSHISKHPHIQTKAISQKATTPKPTSSPTLQPQLAATTQKTIPGIKTTYDQALQASKRAQRFKLQALTLFSPNLKKKAANDDGLVMWLWLYSRVLWMVKNG